VDPRTLKDIMGQGATRPETPRERREREALEADLESSPCAERRSGSASATSDPTPSRRSGRSAGRRPGCAGCAAIEDGVDQHDRQLSEAWRTLAEELEDPAEFAAAWRELAGNWSFAEVNELIERHNRNFPAEARLAMDPRTRDFVRLNGRPYAREPLDAHWILVRFPPDRGASLP
jgi:hypothetical protein